MAIKVGNVVRVAFVKEGGKKNGEKWQQFTISINKKDKETGAYKTLQTFKVYTNNYVEGLQDGDNVKITSITSIDVNEGVYNGKPYKTIILNCNCEKPSASNNNDLDIVGNINNDFQFNPYDSLGLSNEDLPF